jgi:PLP dependent protein
MPRSLSENLAHVEAQIEAACRRSGRARSEIALMAVTKTRPASAILEAAALGITLFGENRVQEYQGKYAELFQNAPSQITDDDGKFARKAQVHFIGHLQSNKAARAVELFAAIDSLDTLHLAERLHEAAIALGRRLPVLVEIKVSSEEAKAGLHPDSPELRDLLERLPELTALELRGLMTVPPACEDPEAVRPYFISLRTLRDQLAAAYPRLSFPELSMGMSHDYPIAIEEGATQIRLGTALFGSLWGSRAARPT